VIYEGIIDRYYQYHYKFVPHFWVNKQAFYVWHQKMYPRFAVTESQKRMNDFRNIKWDDCESVTVNID